MPTKSHSDPRTPDEVRVVDFDAIDSTNAEAMRRARQAENGPLWIVAGRQWQGRGRLGRTWESPAGNLYCSHLLELECPLSAAQQLSLVAAVATFEAVSSLVGTSTQLRLKWPNDVLLDNAKLGGILVESTVFGIRRVAVIGVGLNLVSSPPGLGREATHLAAHGVNAEPQAAFLALRKAMAHWVAVWERAQDFAAIRAGWIERAGPAGQPISVDAGSSRIVGTYRGLDESGGLLMRDAAGIDRHFAFGEVSLLGGEGGSGS